MLTAMGKPPASALHQWAIGEMTGEQAQAAFRSFLSTLGHDARDFALEIDHESQLSDMLGLADRLLTVRRLSTGEERLYAAGPHTSWLAALLQDLEDGHFGAERSTWR
jgi:hypothetical protein